MPVSYEDLAPGYEFPSVRVDLDRSAVAKYVGAVESSESAYVPPLATAARSLAALTSQVSLPAGTIHAAQDFEFYKLVPMESRVECRARVGRKTSRGGMQMLVLEVEVVDEGGEKVQSGKSTLVLPT